MNLNSHRNLLGSLVLIFGIVLILAACAPAAAPATTAPTSAPATAAAKPTDAPKPTEVPQATNALKNADTTQATATVKPAGAPQAAAGKVIYKIVPGESKVTYEVGETFLNQNNRFNLAKGVTTQVTGQITGDKGSPATSTLGEFQIDISQFKSDSDRRDGYIRGNGLESSKYPLAKFVPTKVETLPNAYTEGTDYSFKVTGDLTIKTTTKSVTWDVTTRLTGDTLTGKATTELLMSEFKVGPISILGVLNTEDKVKLTFDFVAKP